MPSLGDLLNGFTGGTQRREAQNANREATTALNTGRDQAINTIRDGKGAWWNPMQTGYDTQQSALNVGYQGAQTGMQHAQNAINQGTGNQQGILANAFGNYQNTVGNTAGTQLGQIGSGYTGALGAQMGSAQRGSNLINRGTQQANQQLTQGAAGNLGALAGGYDQSRQDVTQGYTGARGVIGDQYGRAENAIGQGTQQALGYVQPFQQTGTAANTAYGNVLGLNGADAQRTEFANYSAANNPRAQVIEGDLAKLFNARGLLNSGAHVAATTRELLRDQNSWIDRLGQAAAQGGQYGTTAGQIAQQGGRDLSQLAANRGQSEAGILTGEAGMLAPQAYQYGQQSGGIMGALGSQLAGNTLSGSNRLSDIALNTGDDTSRLYESQGLRGADITGTAGTSIANAYRDLGLQQSGVEGARTSSIANLYNQMGQADLGRGKDIAALAGQRYGTEMANNRQDDQTIAQLLYGNAQQNAGLQQQLGGQLIGAANQGVGNVTNLATMVAQMAMGMPPTGKPKPLGDTVGQTLSNQPQSAQWGYL